MSVNANMRYIVFIISFFGSQLVFAQAFVFPKCVAQVKLISAVPPPQWKIIASVTGDLNNDQRADVAMVIEYHKAVIEKRAYGDAETELIQEFQKPRIMLIYFKNSKGQYQLALQNNNFILRSEEGGQIKEPLSKLKIEENKLNIIFEGGSNWRWILNYQFQYLQKEWTLVGANNRFYNPTSGELNDKWYDFLKRKITETSGNLFTAEDNKVNENILYFSQLRTFNSFKKPWTWEVSKDNFL